MAFRSFLPSLSPLPSPLRSPPAPRPLPPLPPYSSCACGTVFCFAVTPRAYCVPFQSGSIFFVRGEASPVFHDGAKCKLQIGSCDPVVVGGILSPQTPFVSVLCTAAECRDDLRGGKDGLRPRRPQGRREEVLLQLPDLSHHRSRPRGPPLVLAVLQQPAGDEEQVPGPPAGADTAAAGVRQGGGEGEFKRRAFAVGGWCWKLVMNRPHLSVSTHYSLTLSGNGPIQIPNGRQAELASMMDGRSTPSFPFVRFRRCCENMAG